MRALHSKRLSIQVSAAGKLSPFRHLFCECTTLDRPGDHGAVPRGCVDCNVPPAPDVLRVTFPEPATEPFPPRLTVSMMYPLAGRSTCSENMFARSVFGTPQSEPHRSIWLRSTKQSTFPPPRFQWAPRVHIRTSPCLESEKADRRPAALIATPTSEGISGTLPPWAEAAEMIVSAIAKPSTRCSDAHQEPPLTGKRDSLYLYFTCYNSV